MDLPLTRNCIDQETVPQETVPQYRTSWLNREMCSLSWHATKYSESYTGEIGQSFVSLWLSSMLTLSCTVSLLGKLCSPAPYGGGGADTIGQLLCPGREVGPVTSSLGNPCSDDHSSSTASSTAFQTSSSCHQVLESQKEYQGCILGYALTEAKFCSKPLMSKHKALRAEPKTSPVALFFPRPCTV